MDSKKKTGDVKLEVEKIDVRGQKSEVGNSGFEELAGLLRKHPVVIHNTPDRTFIAASLKWQRQNWDVYRRISALVFMDPEVFRFISAHPAAQITGKNINLK